MLSVADLAEFLGKKKPEKPIVEGEKVEGTFCCIECNEVTQQAFLNYDQKTLLWICEKCENFNRVGINV